MKITLATHIVVEHVGNQVFLLDSVGKEVYCLPAEGITHYTSETKTLVVTPELVPEVTSLVDSGVATTTGLVSRRAVVGSTGALIGGGLVAMSMPAAVASQSPSSPVEENFDFEVTGTWEISGTGQGGINAADCAVKYLDIEIDLADVTGLDSDVGAWTLKIFDTTYVLDDDVSEEFTFYYGILEIEELLVNDQNAGLNALCQDFCDLGREGLTIIVTLTAGSFVGKVTLTYDEARFNQACPL